MREIAGKIFLTRRRRVHLHQVKKLARARQLLDEFQQKVDAVADEDRPTEISPKFWDDISCTEYDPRRGEE